MLDLQAEPPLPNSVWPEAKFTIIDDAGHGCEEDGIQKALLDATDAFADLEVELANAFDLRHNLNTALAIATFKMT